MVCAYDPCVNQTKSANPRSSVTSFCPSHQAQLRRTGEMWPIGSKFFRAKEVCSVDNCDRPVHAQGECQAHRRQRVAFGLEPRPIKEHRNLPEGVWFCGRCCQEKPVSMFTQRQQGRHRSHLCKSCHSARMRDYHQRHPTAARRYRLSKFGLTVETYSAIYEAQGGGCSICEAPLSHHITDGTGKSTGKRGWWTCIDHHHGTGVVRGLLCSSCNVALGGFKDDPDLLLKAHRYLLSASPIETA